MTEQHIVCGHFDDAHRDADELLCCVDGKELVEDVNACVPFNYLFSIFFFLSEGLLRPLSSSQILNLKHQYSIAIRGGAMLFHMSAQLPYV